MIGYFLEKLVHDGFAIAKNYAGGYSGLFTILCPEGRYIVVTGIRVCNGVDSDASGSDIALKIEGITRQTSNVFIFRNEGVNPANGFIPNGSCINCYIKSNEDLRLRFAYLGVFLGTDVLTSLPSSKEFSAGNGGYGNETINRSIDIGGGARYLPIGIKYSDPAVITANATSDPFPIIDVNTAIVPGVLPLRNLIFNIEYCIVNLPYVNK